MSRQTLKKLFFTAIDSIKSSNIINKNIKLHRDVLSISNKKYDLSMYENLYIYAVGKAAYDMAKEVENILGDKITSGIVISNKNAKLKYLKHITSSHPLVSDKSVKAAKLLVEDFKKHTSKDLVIFLLSGGASALIELPIKELNLKDFQDISKALLVSGIDIKALNSVRKSISQIKGGKLSTYSKATKEVLVLSDVIGDDLTTIGSAPMFDGITPHKIIGSNKIALQSIKNEIKNKVEIVEIITTKLDGNSKDATKFIIETFKEYDKNYKTFCILFGGETTTIAKENGIGGRNQELALRLLIDLNLDENTNILCAGSDGKDGNSDSTGAFVDIDTIKTMKNKNLDPNKYLLDSNSNIFFKEINSDFTTGITRTNVMDFIIIIKGV